MFLLRASLRRGATTPSCSQAHNWEHSKEFLTAQPNLSVQHNFVAYHSNIVTAQYDFVGYYSNILAQHDFKS